MNFTHKVFHLNKDLSRQKFVDKINIYLSDYSEELQSPTIEISNNDQYLEFIKNNPDFNLNPIGYNLHNQQGWRYGEVGIWASNWTAWKNFLSTDKDLLILMEDDIGHDESFMEYLTKYIQEIPQDWEIFFYYCPADQFPKFNAQLSVSENTSVIYQDWSCACYIISRAGAEKLLKTSSEGISLPLDWHVFRQRNKFKAFTIKPNSKIGCYLNSTDSTFQSTQERKVL